MPNARGFRRVQTTRRWHANRAARLVDPQTPDHYGWTNDGDGTYRLPGVTDVVLVPAPALPGYLLQYNSGYEIYISPGLLKRTTEEIVKENEAS